MRIAVVSDTHNYTRLLIKTLKIMGKFDMLFHLGDHTSDGEKIAGELGIDVVMVKGNCDPLSEYNEEEVIVLNGKKLFLTHGHKYNVSREYNSIYHKAMEIGADIVLFGHTHIPLSIEEDGIILMNPGSPKEPRTPDRIRTFGIIEIGDKIETHIMEIKDPANFI